MRHLEAFRRYGLFIDRSVTDPRHERPTAQGRELPVKSWEAYRDWCQQVRDNWSDDEHDAAAGPHRVNPFADWGR